VQVEGTAVVAESLPLFENIIYRCLCERDPEKNTRE